jgi:hypothetical protein
MNIAALTKSAPALLLIPAVVWLSWYLTNDIALAEALFTGFAVTAAIIAFNLQRDELKQGEENESRGRLLTTFSTILHVAAFRRPADVSVVALLDQLQSLPLGTNDRQAVKMLASVADVRDHWVFLSSFCKLLSGDEYKELHTEREAIAGMLIGYLGANEVSALLEFAGRVRSSSIHYLIKTLWYDGGIATRYGGASNEDLKNFVQQHLEQ